MTQRQREDSVHGTKSLASCASRGPPWFAKNAADGGGKRATTATATGAFTTKKAMTILDAQIACREGNRVIVGLHSFHISKYAQPSELIRQMTSCGCPRKYLEIG